MKIEIQNIYGDILFSFEKKYNTVKDTIKEAIKVGADLHDADLRDANLCGADLCGADLRDAYLRDANLRDAYLRDANLRGADLHDANLCGADLRDAYLRDANLRGADLRSADLCGADLRDANLRGADLRDANLCGADLHDANLRDANLRGADHNESTTFLLSQCPSEGSFTAWKKANGLIVKIEICKDAKRSSATTLKCRCSSALVLEIQNMDGTKSELTEVASNYDSKFIYSVGKVASVENFDEDRFNECSTGIHFFISREMAAKY